MGVVRRDPRNASIVQVQYRDDKGQRRTAGGFRTKGDARAWLDATETDIRRGVWLDPREAQRTFGELAIDWRKTVVHLEPKTLDWYDGLLRVHVLPELEKMPVGAITQATIKAFVSTLLAAGKGARTVHGAYQTARHVLGAAVSAGAIRANPCDGVKLPRVPKREHVFLTAEQVLDLADAIAPPYGTLVTFAAYSGLRAGEIGGLRVGRLNLLRGTVDVVEALKELNGSLSFGPTKNHEHRTVRIPRFLCDELGAYLDGRPTGADDLVFTAPQGGPLRHNQFYKRRFRPAVERAELPPATRFHDLRHTCAALLIANGAHPLAIKERLGHSSISVTIDVYGGLFPSVDEALADGLDTTHRTAIAGRDATAAAR